MNKSLVVQTDDKDRPKGINFTDAFNDYSGLSS